MQAAPMSRGGADDEYTSTASHRSPSSHPRAAGMVGCMSSSGCARRAAEQQQWQRELEGARSLPCQRQSRSRMLLNSRNAGEHQLAAAEQPAATPCSRCGMKSTFSLVHPVHVLGPHATKMGDMAPSGASQRAQTAQTGVKLPIFGFCDARWLRPPRSEIGVRRVLPKVLSSNL